MLKVFSSRLRLPRDPGAHGSGSLFDMPNAESAAICNLFRAENKEIVEKTWANVKANDEEAFTNDFYAKLFDLLPETKLLFKNDQAHQSRALIGAFSKMAASLNNASQLDEHMRNLAQTHMNYGITSEMFDAFGLALVFTLRKHLKADFTAECETAWVQTYNAVSSMIVDNMEEMRYNPEDMPKWLRKSYLASKSTLQRTWRLANEKDPNFIDHFYEHFFQACAQAKPMFKGNEAQKRQKKALQGSITHIIQLMDSPHKLQEQLRALGSSHAKIGVTREMFVQFGKALRATLKDVIGDEYTGDADIVWIRALRLLVDGMVYSTQKGHSKCTIS